MSRRSETRLLRLLLLAGLVAQTAGAQDGSSFETLSGPDLPAEAAALIPAGMRPIVYERGDLNGDGREDAILVLEARKAHDIDGMGQRVRPLLVLTRDANGKLRQRARSDKLVLCPECGGIMGDPLQDVTVERKAFSVSHYGGSGWRWSNLYRFAYSRRDDTWQLVRIEEGSFHASDPNSGTETVRLPPRDYGKIDIADFDPDTLPKPGKH